MFCGNCGTKIEDSVRFCPSCGSKIVEAQPNAQTNTQTNAQSYTTPDSMGKLLISTKASASKKMAGVICSVFMVIMALLILFNFHFFVEMGEDLFDNSTIGILMGIILMAIFFIYPVACAIGFKSFCNVYENGVSGTTGLSLSNPKAPMEKFSVTYDKITNVTESGKTMYIYTDYAKYEILAMTNRAEAIGIIRAQMHR